jgi:hypothetical protein
VPRDALKAVFGLKVAMLPKELGDLGLHGLCEQGASAITKDFCERVREPPCLDELDDGLVGHGVSLLRWRSGGVEALPPYAALIPSCRHQLPRIALEDYVKSELSLTSALSQSIDAG